MAKKILIVEDNADIAKVLAFCLEREGYEVISACDGQEALDRAVDFKPDLLILDLRIPVIDGQEVCRRIKEDETLKQAHIIFLSASDDILNADKMQELCAEALITKPFDTAKLIQRIKGLLG